MAQKRKCLIFFITLLALWCFAWIVISYFYNENIKKILISKNGKFVTPKTTIFGKVCYQNATQTHATLLERTLGRPLKFLDDILYGKPRPTNSSNIFFLETSCQQLFISSTFTNESLRYNIVNLTLRAACSVESAAKHNPNSKIFVLFVSPAYWDNKTLSPAIKAVLSYPNVQLRNVNLWKFAANTPMDKWLNTDKLFSSKHLLTHMSDFLRYLTLWHFSGTYLDSDNIVLRSLEKLPPNYAGAESKEIVAAGVLNFGTNAIGRKVASDCLKDFRSNFDGQKWAQNGPGVISRVVMDICNGNTFADIYDRERCLGFKVYNQTAFYAVHWQQGEKFINEKYAASTLNIFKNSFTAHFWNSQSQNQKVRVSGHSALRELAAANCPKVFATAKEYF